MKYIGTNYIFCTDESSSMNSYIDGMSRIKAVGDAMKTTLSIIAQQKNCMAGMVGFNDSPFIIHSLTPASNPNLMRNFHRVTASGMTDLLGALNLAIEMLRKRPLVFNRKIVLLTDGIHNSGSMTWTALRHKALKHRIAIDTIGFGRPGDYQESLLRQIARETGGEFFAVHDLLVLSSTFKKISRPRHHEFNQNSKPMRPFQHQGVKHGSASFHKTGRISGRAKTKPVSLNIFSLAKEKLFKRRA